MPQPSPREIRIFLSSTFNDMQAERDYLIKKIFPAIKDECRRRGVDFTVLDLRWGITAEEAASGRVIEICLDEIERTRPYFIGLIGGRYGWVPGSDDVAVSSRLRNRYPWIDADLGAAMSITEMEMRFGALRTPGQTDAYFYLRDLGSVARHNLDPAGSEAALRRDALRADILRAARSGLCHAASYDSVRKLGRHVYSDLMAMIDSRFPAGKAPSMLDRIAADHARRLADLTKVYIQVNSYTADDMAKAIGKGQAVRVLGEKGVGKSAFVANTFPASSRLAVKGVGDFEVVHTFIGGEVADRDMALRMLVHSLAQNDPGIERTDLDDLSAELDFDAILASRNPELPPVLWIIDGLERFANESDATLAWLEPFKKHLGGLIAITDSEIFGEGVQAPDDSHLGRLSHETIYPLTPPEVSKIVNTYLRSFAKGLRFGRMAAIAENANMQNPSMLRIFLDELLQFGVFEQLDDFIDSYLAAPDRRAICGLVLERMERDFGVDTVRHILGLLRTLSRGADEEAFVAELRMKEIDWSPIRSVLVRFSTIGNSLIRLDDPDFIAAVDARYAFDEPAQAELRSEAKRILDRTFALYSRQYRSLYALLRSLLNGAVGRFLGPEVGRAGSEKVRICVGQMLRLAVDSRDIPGINSLLRRKMLMVMKPEDMTLLTASGLISDPELDLSHFISYRELLLSSTNSVGLVVTNTIAVLDPSGRQRSKVERRIRRMWLPRRLKRRALNALTELEDYRTKTVEEILDPSILSTMLGMGALSEKIPYVLIIDSTQTLDSILSKCDSLLQSEEFVDSEKSIIIQIASLAATRRGELERALQYLAGIDRETENNTFIDDFIRAFVAIKQYVRDGKSKSTAETAVAVFRHAISGLQNNQLAALLSIWIKEWTVACELSDPLTERADLNLGDAFLMVLAFGLYYEGLEEACPYLEMVPERDYSDSIKFEAAAYAAQICRAQNKYEESARYYTMAHEYYKKLKDGKPSASLLLSLVHLYRVMERYSEYVSALHELLQVSDYSVLPENLRDVMLSELTATARLVVYKFDGVTNRRDFLEALFRTSEEVLKGNVYSVSIAIYITILDNSDELVTSEIFENSLQEVTERQLYRKDAIFNALIDFMIFRGEYQRAIDIQKQWFNEIRRPIDIPGQEETEQAAETHERTPLYGENFPDDLEEALELAMYSDGIQGEVEHLFGLIKPLENVEEYIIRYLDGLLNYISEMEMHEERFSTKLDITATYIRPFMQANDEIRQRMSRILSEMSRLQLNPWYGPQSALSVARLMIYLDIPAEELASVRMSLLPWLGRPAEALDMHKRLFADVHQPAVDFAHALALWQSGDDEAALRILDEIGGEADDPSIADLRANILAGQGRYEDAADVLLDVDRAIAESAPPADYCADSILRALVYAYAGRYQEAFNYFENLNMGAYLSLCIPTVEEKEDEDEVEDEDEDAYRYAQLEFIPGSYSLYSTPANSMLDFANGFSATVGRLPDEPLDGGTHVSDIVSQYVRATFYLLVGNETDARAAYGNVAPHEAEILSMDHYNPTAYAAVLFYAEAAALEASRGNLAAARTHLDKGHLILSHLHHRAPWATLRLDQVDAQLHE